MGSMSDAALVFSSQPVLHLAALFGVGSVFQRFDIVKLFEVISVLGSALTAFKLYQAGLHRRYRILFVYLVFRVPYISCAFFRNTQPRFYAWFFVLSEPLIMSLYVLIVLELYRLVLERYRGLYTLGRWAMGAAMSIALAVSIMSLRV